MKKLLPVLFLLCNAIFSSNLIYANESSLPRTSYAQPIMGEPLSPVKITNSVDHGIPPPPNSIFGPSFRILENASKWRHEKTSTPIRAGVCATEMYALTTPNAVVNYLKTHSYNKCVDDLWDYSTDMKKLFTVANINAVLNEIARMTSQYDGTNTGHIYELLFFGKIAFYQRWFHPSDFDILSVKPLMAVTLQNLFNAPHIYDKTAVAGTVLQQLVESVGSAELDAQNAAGLEKTLGVFINDMTRIDIYDQAVALYDVFYTISRSTWNRVLTAVSPSLVDILRRFSILTLPSDDEWIISNAAWDLGVIAMQIPASKAAAQGALEQAYYTHTQWSSPWMGVVNALFLASPCVTFSTGTKVCKATLQEELTIKIFPKAFSFESGNLMVFTSLGLGTIEPLYYATKEERAHFGRMNKRMTPVDNDPNPTLDVYLYATRKDYETYQPFLFNLSTDNGGMYTEWDGRFYTYERTTAESIYTLQELFRHEYTHYLDARYIFQGMDGDYPIYENDRLTFFDEGSAEFLAGSMIQDSVFQRKKLVTQVKNLGTANRSSISTIIGSNYNTPNFYLFAGMFINFLYDKHIDYYQKLSNIIYANDVNAYDILTNQWKNNAALNTEFQAYLDQAVANVNNLITPESKAPLDSDLIYSNPSQIQTLLQNTGMVTNTTCTSSPNLSPSKIFICQGKISGVAMNTKNNTEGWYNLNTRTNLFLKTLVGNNVHTNLNWTSCRFEEIPGSANSYVPTAKYYCEGPLA